MRIRECPRCKRTFTAENNFRGRGYDSKSVVLCQCGYFVQVPA